MTPSGFWNRCKPGSRRETKNGVRVYLAPTPFFCFGDVLVTLVRNRRSRSTFHTQIFTRRNVPHNSSQITT